MGGDKERQATQLAGRDVRELIYLSLLAGFAAA